MFFLIFFYIGLPVAAWVLKYYADNYKVSAIDFGHRANNAVVRKYRRWSKIFGWGSLALWIVTIVFFLAAFSHANHSDGPDPQNGGIGYCGWANGGPTRCP